MLKFKPMFLLLVVLSLVLAACGPSGGGGGEEGGGGAVTGDAARGKSLFEQTVIGPNSAPGCTTCHSLEPGVTLVGPSLADVATEAAEIIEKPDYTGEAKTVEEYLRESIMNPNAFAEEGFSTGVMYQNYAKDLSEQEIADLVAFLMTLK